MGVCRRIRDTISEKEIPVNDHSLPVTVSQCLVVWDGKAGVQEFIAAAESTLSATKTRGRNRLEKAAPPIKSASTPGGLPVTARRRIQRPYVDRYRFHIFLATGVSISNPAATSSVAAMGRSRKVMKLPPEPIRDC